jgi:hypothetical protein
MLPEQLLVRLHQCQQVRQAQSVHRWIGALFGKQEPLGKLLRRDTVFAEPGDDLCQPLQQRCGNELLPHSAVQPHGSPAQRLLDQRHMVGFRELDELPRREQPTQAAPHKPPASVKMGGSGAATPWRRANSRTNRRLSQRTRRSVGTTRSQRSGASACAARWSRASTVSSVRSCSSCAGACPHC